MRRLKVVSGGQTGVDRAALDAAMELGVEVGGWCPAGRLAEDGVIAERYPLVETPRRSYGQRTAWNVRDSDGTLVVARRPLSGGTALTERLAVRMGKPCLIVHPQDGPGTLGRVLEWIAGNRIAVLNVAGPRQRTGCEPYCSAKAFLRDLLNAMPQDGRDRT